MSMKETRQSSSPNGRRSPKPKSPLSSSNDSLSDLQVKELKSKMTVKKKGGMKVDWLAYILLTVVVAITIFTYPEDLYLK